MGALAAGVAMPNIDAIHDSQHSAVSKVSARSNRVTVKGNADGVDEMEQKADQDQLCCGGLLEADTGNGSVVLRCLTCGLRWERKPDGTLTAATPRNPEQGAQSSPS